MQAVLRRWIGTAKERPTVWVVKSMHRGLWLAFAPHALQRAHASIEEDAAIFLDHAEASCAALDEVRSAGIPFEAVPIPLDWHVAIGRFARQRSLRYADLTPEVHHDLWEIANILGILPGQVPTVNELVVLCFRAASAALQGVVEFDVAGTHRGRAPCPAELVRRLNGATIQEGLKAMRSGREALLAIGAAKGSALAQA